ncbi:MAG: hypothetical protein WCI73_01415 [Phycisphaerae bacterium]
MIIRCPSCRRPTYVDEALMGHLARCEHCRVFMKLRAVSCPVNEMASAAKESQVMAPVATLGPAQTQHPAALRRQFVRDLDTRPAWRVRQRGAARTRLFTMFAVGVAFTLMGLAVITLIMNIEQMSPGPRAARAAAGPGVGMGR